MSLNPPYLTLTNTFFLIIMFTFEVAIGLLSRAQTGNDLLEILDTLAEGSVTD